jgi:hypothetical protein
MMNANVPKNFADAFLNAPLTFFDAPLMIFENPQTSDDTPFLSKTSKVILKSRSFQNCLKSTFLPTYGSLRNMPSAQRT